MVRCLRTAALFLLLLPLVAMAQVKIGFADVPRIYSQLPELAQARNAIEARSNELHGELENMRLEMERKYGEYQTINANPATAQIVKERRLQEIQELDRKIQQFVASVAFSMRSYEDTLLLPVVDKVSAAIKKVGEDNGYLMILADLSVQPTSVLTDSGLQPVYMSTAVEDVTSLVLVELGIAPAAEPAAEE